MTERISYSTLFWLKQIAAKSQKRIEMRKGVTNPFRKSEWSLGDVYSKVAYGLSGNNLSIH